MERRRFSILVGTAPLALGGLMSGCGGTGNGSGSAGPAEAGAGTVGSAGMRNLTSVQISREMSPGINLGNTLEAIPEATSWGNPPPTRALMQAYKAAGFRSVRIPVAWTQYADVQGRIGAAWMAHVKQVVGHALDAGLYAIVNIHWDGGWMNHPTYDKQASINARITTYWAQIARAFQEFDDRLLFAGTNEVGQEGTWQGPTPEYAAVQNSFNQTFVDTVRATGGNNAARHLIVQGYWTNVAYTLAHNTLPSDRIANRLFMEVHFYDPYNFTLNGDSKIWQWGAGATDPAATEAWASEAAADEQFRRLKAHFVDRGVAVLVGEYGAYVKPAYPGMAPYRKAWAQSITRAIVRHDLVPVWWDTGELIDRHTAQPKVPDVLAAIVDAARR
ncbi:glycoside hydrolase family 5 protein [Aquabacterium humicola]|uniref:glycoside hydrolase family 5 protein n=1 Tax=Aquabacterium humicola TaxID=3237377 RepID=UPI0025434039|nr:glycoside hydrolase family 5 protein [Rubrivivax pictus]